MTVPIVYFVHDVVAFRFNILVFLHLELVYLSDICNYIVINSDLLTEVAIDSDMFLMNGKVKNLLPSDMFVMFFRLKCQVLSFVVINFLIPMLILLKIQEDNCCPAKY